MSETVVYTYLDGPKVSIGRAAHMDIVALTEGVSRTHARFERHAKGFKISMPSENGTYLNGKRVEQAELYDGDIIRLGRLQLRYETVEVHGYESVVVPRSRLDPNHCRRDLCPMNGFRERHEELPSCTDYRPPPHRATGRQS